MNKDLSKKGTAKMPSFIGPLLAVIILSIVLAIASEHFLTFSNWMNIFRQTAINALISGGMLLVLLTGGVDLSVGSMVALTSCTMGVLMTSFGIQNPGILMGSALLVGLLCGSFNAMLFTKFKLPHPFVSTMGSKMIFRGIALFITGASPIGGFPNSVTFLGSRNIGDFPICFIAIIIVFAIMHVFLTRSALGRKIYSVGGNKEAARLSGISVPRTLNFVYIMSGFMCALAGIVMVGRVGTSAPLAGETYDTDAIAACVIGGASFSGGKGTMAGTIIGAMLIAIIRNGLNLLGAQTDVQYIVIGAVIIIAVLIDVIRTSSANKSKRLSKAKAKA
ncbi:MAG: ABC transporter permease [Lachnospiraceae bacterium]